MKRIESLLYLVHPIFVASNRATALSVLHRKTSASSFLAWERRHPAGTYKLTSLKMPAGCRRSHTGQQLNCLILALCFTLCGNASPAETAKKTPISPKVYSPNHQFYAYVKGSDKTVDSGKGDVSADEIWLCAAPEKEVHPLFKSGASIKTQGPISEIFFGDIHDLSFSNDNRELYFLNAAFAVSDAVLAVDLKTRKFRYVIDGNSLELVRQGRWKGNLIVERHKYHDADKGGAYEASCVITPQGKELKQLKVLSE